MRASIKAIIFITFIVFDVQFRCRATITRSKTKAVKTEEQTPQTNDMTPTREEISMEKDVKMVDKMEKDVKLLEKKRKLQKHVKALTLGKIQDNWILKKKEMASKGMLKSGKKKRNFEESSESSSSTEHSPSPSTGRNSNNEEEIYEVDAVREYRYNAITKRPEWRIHWQGFPSDVDTWEPWENLCGDDVRHNAEHVRNCWIVERMKKQQRSDKRAKKKSFSGALCRKRNKSSPSSSGNTNANDANEGKNEERSENAKETDNEYQVDSVYDYRYNKEFDREEWKIHWQGWPPNTDTWEPWENLNGKALKNRAKIMKMLMENSENDGEKSIKDAKKLKRRRKETPKANKSKRKMQTQSGKAKIRGRTDEIDANRLADDVKTIKQKSMASILSLTSNAENIGSKMILRIPLRKTKKTKKDQILAMELYPKKYFKINPYSPKQDDKENDSPTPAMPPLRISEIPIPATKLVVEENGKNKYSTSIRASSTSSSSSSSSLADGEEFVWEKGESSDAIKYKDSVEAQTGAVTLSNDQLETTTPSSGLLLEAEAGDRQAKMLIQYQRKRTKEREKEKNEAKTFITYERKRVKLREKCEANEK